MAITNQEDAQAGARPARMRQDVEVLAAGPRNRRHAPGGIAAAEQYVQTSLEAAGWRVHRDLIELRWQLGLTDSSGPRPVWPLRLHRRLSGANLYAELPGADAGPRIVVAAHLDSVKDSPGADDNASGVAVLLELARSLSVTPPRRPVTLAVLDFEEVGQLGARAAVDHLTGAGPVAAMICLESVGYFDTAAGSQRLPASMPLIAPRLVRAVRDRDSRGDFLLVAHQRSSAAIASAWVEAAALTDPAVSGVLVQDPRPVGRFGRVLGTLLMPPAANFDRSDHAPFARRGIPTIALCDTVPFRSPHYHRPTDTPDTLDYPRLAAVAAATAALIVRWPDAAASPRRGIRSRVTCAHRPGTPAPQPPD